MYVYVCTSLSLSLSLWIEVLAALRTREAGPLLEELEDGAQDSDVGAIVSYHFAKANTLWGAELTRITEANNAEIKRIQDEADAAAAEAAAAVAEEEEA